MAGKTRQSPRIRRNYELAPGVPRFSAARMFAKRGIFAKKSLVVKKKPDAKKSKTEMKKIGGDKNGGERAVVVRKTARYLAESRVKASTLAKNKTKKAMALRRTISPGTVLIILTGRHKGKRVVFLKQLEKSGLLLVTGPMKLNSTPMRRIGQAFVIATKLKLDLAGLQLPQTVNDAYFRRKNEKRGPRKGDADIFAAKSGGYAVSDERKKDQKTVDGAVMAAIKKHKESKSLLGYLGSRFALGKNQHPHKMVF